MPKPPKELPELGKSQGNSKLRFTDLSLASTECMARPQMEAARRAGELDDL